MAAKKSKGKEKVGAREIPEFKIKTVDELSKKIKSSRTVLIASTKGLPSSQFHEIKKKMRGKAEIKVAKKSLVIRAIEKVEKGALQNLKSQVVADVALFFSEIDPFELSALLTDNQSPAKAKAGEIALEDITVEPGPTSLVPGPAISELSGVGLKVAVEGGKLAIKQPAILARQGEPIKENVANVLAKLDILPMKVGFIPLAAYDAQDDKVYVGIRIDKKEALKSLRESIGKALGFAINIKHITKETIKHFIMKAVIEEKALNKLVQSKPEKTETETQQNQTQEENK